MIKTALIVPKGSKYGKNPYLKIFLERNDIVSKFYGAWETPNLSLLTIAGLFPDSFDLRFIDEDHGQAIPWNEGFDLVVVTGMTQQINRAYAICDAFRTKGVYTVLGGIHASIYPDEAAKHADTVTLGEGEIAFARFLSDFCKGKPQKRYRADEYVDLDTSPVPRYDLTVPELYASYSIQTTRGCPRTCAYCTLPVIYGSVYRHKSVEQVVREIRAIKAVSPNAFIFFADDNMFIHKEHSLKLLQAIAKENITWGTQTDISVAEQPDILKMLRPAGCRWLFIGLENVNRRSLELLDEKQWKARLCENYPALIDAIHRAGVYIWGSFMFGTDNDTTAVFEDTLRFTLDNGLYSGSFTILTPLPGTALFEQMKAAGRLTDMDWSRYTFWDVVYRPKNMTGDELARGVAWMYGQFYSEENSRLRLQKIRESLQKNHIERKMHEDRIDIAQRG